MIQIDLPTLVNRLNPIARHSLEAAAAHCVSQQEAEITVSQVLLQMISTPLCDVRLILSHAGVEEDELRESLDQRVSGYQAITQAYPSFSPLLVEWLQDSWLLASTEMEHSQLRSGVMLLTLLLSPSRYLVPTANRLLSPINRELLRQNFANWTADSAETPRAEKGLKLATAQKSMVTACWPAMPAI